MEFSKEDFGYYFSPRGNEAEDQEQGVALTNPLGVQSSSGPKSGEIVVSVPVGQNTNPPESGFKFAKNELDFAFMHPHGVKPEQIESFKEPRGAQAAPGMFCCLCCCCLFLVSLFVGSLLVFMGKADYFDVDASEELRLGGGIMTIFSAYFIFCAFMCCCLACVSGSLGSGIPSGKSAEEILNMGKPTSDFKLKLERLNGKYAVETDKLRKIRTNLLYTTGVQGKIPQLRTIENKVKEDIKKIGDAKKAEVEQRIKDDIENNFTPTMIANRLRPLCIKIDFEGDISVSTIDVLREQITLAIKLGTPGLDIVVVNITSPGGSVMMYGLAASQLIRIKNAGLKLLVCVDSVAASGGYMMASVADEIYAAPFAFVGSIGVISIIPNIDKLLKHYDVETHILTAGKYKSTVNVVGEVTEKDKQKYKEELEMIHTAFKDHIILNRPQLADTIDKLATGEAFMAVEGRKLNLVDHISTSDELLEHMSNKYEIIDIKIKPKNDWKDFLEDLRASYSDRFSLSSMVKLVKDSLAREATSQQSGPVAKDDFSESLL